MAQARKVKARIRDRRADMCRAVRVAQGLLQHDAVAGLGLDREGKEAVRCEHTGGGGRDAPPGRLIRKDVGGNWLFVEPHPQMVTDDWASWATAKSAP